MFSALGLQSAPGCPDALVQTDTQARHAITMTFFTVVLPPETECTAQTGRSHQPRLVLREF
jgi:hypothetical protein